MTRLHPRASLANSEPAPIKPVANATVPYWRTELHPLDEHRSTPELPEECTVAIIGSGMSGVAFAYHLLQLYGNDAKPSIALLEARQVCSGATGRNGGHVKMKSDTYQNLKRSQGIEAAEEVAANLNTIIHEIKAVVEKERLDCEFELRRSYDIFFQEDEAKAAEENFYASITNHEEWTKDVSFIKENVQQVTSIKGAKAAISMPACSLWPYKFVTQLLQRIIDDVNLQTNTTVDEVSTEQDSGLQVLKTSRGQLRAKKVIFASNGYVGGLSSVFKGKIVPVRITASHLSPQKPVSPHLSHTYNLEYSSNNVDYLNPRPDGGIVVGGAKPQYVKEKNLWYNNVDDSKLLPHVHEYFDGLMQRHFKGWENSGSKLDHLWTGIIGYTADSMPHVGEVPGMEGKQYILAGYNGGGMALIFTAAQGLAKMVKNGVLFEETELPRLFKTTKERLKKSVEDPEDRT